MFSNIVGSTLGSLLIGFVLMNHFGGEAVAIELALATVVTGFVILCFSTSTVSSPPRWGWGLAAVSLLAILLAHSAYKNLYGKLIFENHASEAELATKYTEENRNGVIVIAANDAVYSGGVYDGFFNVDPVNDKNMIIRAYAVSLLHPHPRRMLMIGLSSGSWAQVLANDPEVETFDIVEINPGYLPIIEHYPQISSVLRNPKVHLYIDDGRRWLLAHPSVKYDVVVVNSTFHWRDHSSTLLSTEFLRLVKAHLLPGGMHFYNTTSSREVYATGLHEYKYGMRVVNFVAVSDSPFQLNAQAWIQQLREFQIDGHRMFDTSTLRGRKTLENYQVFAESHLYPPRDWGLEPGDALAARLGPQRLITDDNMGEEWDWKAQ